MRERPILFSGEMIRAILAGRKSQTRRVIRPQPPTLSLLLDAYDGGPQWNFWTEDKRVCNNLPMWQCPYGVPGDRLVFLCAWAAPKKYNHIKPSRLPRNVRIWSLFDGEPKPKWCGRSRPGRFMPLWLRARMPKGELTEIRVQRVQEISEEDAKAEGADLAAGVTGPMCGTYRGAFCRLWDSINGKKHPWDSNPYVWVLSFRRLPAPQGPAHD
jgi:hypothetical protein